ncbi:hypothetical protein SAMN04488030_2568 [Aliiroseovarius halocynthiae]|uniref:Uncharacterized protein n=1 Tax=Aliiroseovarius halocynthiae TaxID=985055 RepID=A0A545SQ06_9RHOB|nr:hypothetical protein [Aliiroseovarius halocynthiae]TQV67059.1 hypothetical protein FIL88_10745 [Aliiroseovarius halocynthiae]SMR82222.1 hypothetical protein SAMN04488030_2568 [Aliiroseovarius halocynthiae]
MRWIVPFLLAAPPAIAEGFTTQVTADFDANGIADHVALVEFGDHGQADLLLKMGGKLQTIWLHNLIWVGGIGQQPSLTVTPNGSLQMMSHNSSIGRNRWEQIHTLAWRDGAMRVVGYTYRWYDTLNLEDSGSCDLNLLTGKGEISEGQDGASRSISVSSPAFAVQDWLFEMPPECQALFD